jgi:hypothetical protein
LRRGAHCDFAGGDVLAEEEKVSTAVNDAPRDPLELFGVYDRGTPGKERIVLRALEPVSLSAYAVILGADAGSGNIIPFHDHFYWLGNTTLAAGSWVFLYTGAGQAMITTETNTRTPVQALYWGKAAVVFTNPLIIPAVLRAGDVMVWQKNRQVQQGIIDEARTKNYLRELMQRSEDK